MIETELKQRTKKFALRVMKLVGQLEKLRSTESRVIANQLMRSGTSVGANYRAACRARSLPDFLSKLSIVEEEADESGYWMELVIEGGLMKKSLLAPLLQEASEIVAVIVASRKRAAAGDGRTSKVVIRNSKQKS